MVLKRKINWVTKSYKKKMTQVTIMYLLRKVNCLFLCVYHVQSLQTFFCTHEKTSLRCIDMETHNVYTYNAKFETQEAKTLDFIPNLLECTIAMGVTIFCHCFSFCVCQCFWEISILG
jgi:hypothetical protein